MNIRKATPNDVPAIAALHATSWQNTYSRVLTSTYLTQSVPSERLRLWQERLLQPRPNQHVFVAEEANQLLGFACLFIDEHPTQGSLLDNLHVTKLSQDRGIGKQLVRQIATTCLQEAESPRLYLSVNQDNQRAQGFYFKLGAINAATTTWQAPDRSVVPTYRFEWTSVDALLEQ